MSVTEAVRFGPYCIAGPRGPLRRNAQAIPLPPKALAVLWELVRCAGEVVTKEELFAAAWPKSVVSEGVIAACLRDLRHALGDDPKAPCYIATVHRIGYRFIAEVIPIPAIVKPVAQSDSTWQAADFFVGRNAELACLHAAFAKALGGQRQFVFVTGEAGIGKTGLVETLLAQLQEGKDAGRDSGSIAASLWLAHGQYDEHHGPREAYMPVLEALGRLCRQADGERLVALLRRYAPTWLIQLPALLSDAEHIALRRKVAGGTRERMLREIVEVLEAAAAEQPLVLVLEDLHWSGMPTLDLLTMLARRRQAARLLVIATFRPVDLIATNHPLKNAKRELVARGAASEVSLECLTAQAVQAYIEQRFAGRGREFAAAVYRRTEGHPLFMVRVADYLETAHASLIPLVMSALEAAIPSGLRDLIEAQLARLEREERACLEVASIAGTEFAVASVMAGLQTNADGAETVCEKLARREQFIDARGLAEWPDGSVSGRYGFRHALYREVLYDRVSAARRVRLHGQIAKCMAAGYAQRSGEIAAELAVHFEHGGDLKQAMRYRQQAARNSLPRNTQRRKQSLTRAKGPGSLSSLGKDHQKTSG